MKRFPAGFEDRMKADLGSEWENFLAAHDADPPVSIRINPSKYRPALTLPIPWSTLGCYLEKRPVFTLDPVFHAGAYYVQDASSMFLEQAMRQATDLTQPLRILDLCAAPGGKSTHLLSLASEQSLLVSNEVIGSRVTVLSQNLQKWGNSNSVITRNDPADFKSLEGYFDVVVIDAPCSGEGLFRKDPDAIGEWSQDAVELCSRRQHRIIRDVWPALRQNGILIYCTCTFNEKENEDHARLLAQQDLGESVPLRISSDWGIEEINRDSVFGYRFFPHRAKGEGFFLTVLRKTETIPSIRSKPNAFFPVAARKTLDQVNQWIQEPEKFQFVMHEDLVVAIPASRKMEIEWLQGHLNVLSKGTAIGRQKHETFVPEHSLALAHQLNKQNVRLIELDKEQALNYLRKENVTVRESPRGFAAVTFEGLALGWVNILDRRINNLYPASWRIRMGS